MTLATLFDFPWEDRRKLTRWSDVTTAAPETGIVESYEARREELIECAMYFKGLWEQRINEEPKNDLISIMAHSPATRDMPFLEFLGNLLLLIEIGRAHVLTPVTNAHLVCRLLLEKNKKHMNT